MKTINTVRALQSTRPTKAKQLILSVALMIAFNIQYAIINNQSKAQVVEDWISIYDAGGSDIARTMAIDDSGFIYIAGGSYLSGYSKYLTVKYNPSGNIIWVANYSGSSDSSDSDRVYAMAVDNSGNVYVTGQSYSGSKMDYATVKYNSNGVEQWVARYDGGGDSIDIARAIAVDDSGNVYVAGHSFNGSNYNFVTIKYNSMGDTLWEAFYNGGGNWQPGYGPKAIAVDGSGNVYVCGDSVYFNNSYYVIIKYNTNGVKQWIAIYDTNVIGNYYYLSDMAVDDNGNVYVTGYFCDTSCVCITIKYNTNGSIQWVARYDGGGSGYGKAIVLDDSGNVYVTGDNWDGTNAHYATIKYNTNGDTLWTSATFVVDGSMSDFAKAIAVDKLHNVYVTGYSFVSADTTDEFATVKYNSNGTLEWAAYYKGNGNAFWFGYYAKAIVLDTLGNAYVTGFGWNGKDLDCITIKYGDSLFCDSVNAEIFVPELKCNWDSITLLAGGGANYLWSSLISLSDSGIANPIAFPNTTTIYTVIVSNYCSSDTAQITLPVNLLPIVIDTNIVAVTQGNNDGAIDITVSGGLPPYSFSWSNGAITEDLDSIAAGSYTVTVTDSLGCIDSATIQVPQMTGINITHSSNIYIESYPNPFSDITTIMFRLTKTEYTFISIFNSSSEAIKLLFNGKANKNEIYYLDFDAKDIPSGIYYYHLVTETESYTKKLVIIK